MQHKWRSDDSKSTIWNSSVEIVFHSFNIDALLDELFSEILFKFKCEC